MATFPRKSDTLTSLTGKAPASVTVFHVGPKDQDLNVLKEIVRRTDFKMCPGTSWRLAETDDFGAVTGMLEDRGVPIVVCEHDAGGGDWKNILARVVAFPTPPVMIVASRTADEYLWAEALNLGAYDVLSKPYSATEVERVLSMAWLRWAHRPLPVATLAQAC